MRDDPFTEVLFLCSLAIGVLTGCFAVLLQRFEGKDQTSFV